MSGLWELKIKKNTILLENIKNVNEYMQAFDLFLFPSLYEGLGIVLIEAQASGLPVILADTITKEVGVTNCVKYLPLSDDKAEWVREILNFRGFKRYSRCEELKRAGFDEKDVARYFQNYYLKVLENLK